MKRFNHKEINEKVCNRFNLKCYRQGKFTHFKNDVIEIGYIEQIGKTNKYLQTLLINFFDFENKDVNDDIVNFIVSEYKNQKKIIDKTVQGLNISLEQRGNNICKSTLI